MPAYFRMGRDSAALRRLFSEAPEPELPCLLYVMIQSTRDGCLDPDSKKLSKAAHTLLHARFEGSVSAGKSPYWY